MLSCGLPRSCSTSRAPRRDADECASVRCDDDQLHHPSHLPSRTHSGCVSVAVTCHIVPTLPEAWPALCKTTCARFVRPRCDAPHPLPPRCSLRVHWHAGWERLALAAACHQSPPVAASLCASIHAASKPPALRPRRLGCEEAHPLVWTGTGKFVGDAQR